MSLVPVDEQARERVRSDHDTSFVLVAGAGTGKTTLLVDRIEALVRRGRAQLTDIAAVTFTENAATTLKLRLRERLERARADAQVPAEERGRAAAALVVLERAAISTIHALCAAMLAERPIECGVVPGFEVTDDLETDRLFAEAWEEWLGENLMRGEEALTEALDAGVPIDGGGSRHEGRSLRGLARRLVEQRDLAPRLAETALSPEQWREELFAAAAPIPALLSGVSTEDLLAVRLQGLVTLAQQARFLSGDALLAHVGRLNVIPRQLGQKRLWPDAEKLAAARNIARWTGEAIERWHTDRGAATHARLVRLLQGVVQRYDQKKAARGRLDFVDLLVKARDALRNRESLRREFRARFRYVIIDEFQDTDPLQCEIVESLTRGRPGALVVVGDAKQSIYRFRRAEVSRLAQLAREAEQAPDAAVLHLTQNFRSRAGIVRFVNRVFANLIEASDEAEQPAYEPIAARTDIADRRSVLALRFAAEPLAEHSDLLRAEAAAVAQLASAAAHGHWGVRDPLSGAERPSRAGDVMILVRRLTQIRFLEEALEVAGLRFVVEGGKAFFDRQEVHETLAALRVIEDPTQRLALVAALRSAFFGVSDLDLAGYVLAGGALTVERAAADLASNAAIGPALALLARLHEERLSVSVPRLIERLYDETRVLATLAGTRRGEAQIANLEKVVSLARAAERNGVLTLRGYIRLLAERIAEGSEEPDLPASRPGDPATLRILTIHKAKGLEAPIVVLHDTADDGFAPVDVVALRESGEVAIGFRAGCQPPGWAALVRREERRIWAESRRLLYVACTRARDLLVVPRPPADAQPGAFWRDLIHALPAADDQDVEIVSAEGLPQPVRVEPAPGAESAHPQDVDAAGALWERERQERIAGAAYRAFAPVAVTRAAAEVAPPAPSHAGLPEALRFGSLVHRLLELTQFDGATGTSLAELAASHATAEGLDADAALRAAATVERTLAHELFARVRRARSFRELPVWLPEDGRLLEGQVDLVFEEAGGLVLVDYKTEPITEAQAVDQAAHHAPQLRLYARALTQATGLPVRERLVFFTALARAVAV